MAEQIAHDVVNQSLSVGDQSPSDAHADTTIHHSSRGIVADAETRGDQDGGKSEQYQRSWIESAVYPTTNGQDHVCPTIASSDLHHPKETCDQNVPEPIEPTPVEPVARSNNKIHDMDMDGTLSPSHSIGDLSAGASDSEARKAETTSASGVPKMVDNSIAAKKPTTFKPVSFAKYSAAKVAGINSTAKPTGDKVLSSSGNSPTASLQPGSRPRLVAKSASGLRDNASKLFKQGGRVAAGDPDPMQVWNKNRAAPSSSAKHLTDEELKQQYGIHMTSRIEADGENKEAKWADIDDDEDDWAPESIEWADGTKVTLSTRNAMPESQEAAKPEGSAKEQPSEVRTLRPKVSSMVSSVGPKATVLKLGASTERQQAQKATSSQKSTSEKAAQSIVKSPAPVPAKSPWAPLPPVDRLPPVIINHQAPASWQGRPDQVFSGALSPPMGSAASPAKEISADDFNRSWRDSQPSQTRELFMPSSGRYEAVGENKRRSSRNDQSFRPPALLQRPSPGEQHVPAEPSPAFQTSRISADQERSPWDRRRASSIQSGGSGHQGRRMSVAQSADFGPGPPELPQLQRASSQTGASDALTTSRGVHVQQGTKVPSQPAPIVPHGPSSDLALIAEQKRLMQESARLAVQRRREEEEKEEAARKERIRVKLEQLGPPPDQKSKAQNPITEVVTKSEETVTQISSPPKPPVPEPTGEPKQYGMMKVHHPDNVKKLGSLPEKPETLLDTKMPDGEQPQKTASAESPEAATNGLKAGPEAITEQQPQEALPCGLATEDNLQAWKNNLTANEPLHGWKTRNHPTAATGNLWGLPHHDKALGNGTFDQGLTGLSGRDLSVRNSSSQHSWLNGALPSHESSPQVPSTRTMSTEDGQATPSFPSSEQRPIAANSEADSVRPIGKPLPIGPPQTNHGHQRWQQLSSNPRAPKNGIAAWNNFHAVAAREDRAENERYQRDQAVSLEEEARTGARKAPAYAFNETWKQIEIGDHTGDRQVTSVARASVNAPFPGAFPYSASGGSFNNDRAANGLPVRGSRFFPTEARRAVTYHHPTVSRSPSPPPAEGFGSPHPVYGGDAKRPIINFPVPKAVVKLPKPQEKGRLTPPPPAAPRTFAAAVAAQPPPPPPPPPLSRAVSQPLARASDWQHRINDLFGRNSSPKKQVLAVSSSSREPLDVLPLNMAAAVSLPPSEIGHSKDAGKVTSKDVEEEDDLFEDREAASRPLVHVPRDVPTSLKHPIRIPSIQSRSRQFLPEVDPVSAYSFDFLDELRRSGKGKDTSFCVHLPGSTMSTRKIISTKEADTNFAPKGGRNPNFSHKFKKGPARSRESSGCFQSPAASNKGGHNNNNNNASASANGNNSGITATNRSSASRRSPAANGPMPSPRSGFSHRASNLSGWKGSHSTSAGVAH